MPFVTLRRVTSSGRYIPVIDGLRFAAILSVVLFHLQGYVVERASVHPATALDRGMVQAIGTGTYGVQLFFAISGFVLALPFAMAAFRGGRPISYRAYYLRRLTRLEPPYVLSLLGYALLLVLYVGQSARDIGPHLAASMAYLHGLIYGAPSTINVVTWSLEIEVQFYLVAPLLMRVYRLADPRARRSVLVVATLAAMGVEAMLPPAMPRLGLSLVSQLSYFLTGLLLADLYVTSWECAPTVSAAWDLVSALGWPALIATLAEGVPPRWVLPPMILLLYVAAFRGRLSARAWSWPVVTTIGGMCYTIYLLHYALISFAGRFTVPHLPHVNYLGTLAMAAAVILPVVGVVSIAYFVLVERPCMRPDWPQRLAAWGGRLLERGQRAVPAARSADSSMSPSD